MPSQTWTFTFSENVENHAGMEQIGQKANRGFSVDELKAQQKHIDELKNGPKTEWMDLEQLDEIKSDQGGEGGDEGGQNDENKFKPAAVLVIRKGLQYLLRDEKGDSTQSMEGFKAEIRALNVDKKAWMRNKVKNKIARWNLCMADFDQEPKYEEKKGRVVSFAKLPYLNRVREGLVRLLGERARGLFAELNHYYDTSKCGIGDTERRIVVGARMGATMDLNHAWFHRGCPVSQKHQIVLNEGDIYVMSDKAVGSDWKQSSQYTLRHSAGAPSYTKLPAIKKASKPPRSFPTKNTRPKKKIKSK